jgi:hypothetical protein
MTKSKKRKEKSGLSDKKKKRKLGEQREIADAWHRANPSAIRQAAEPRDTCLHAITGEAEGDPRREAEDDPRTTFYVTCAPFFRARFRADPLKLQPGDIGGLISSGRKSGRVALTTHFLFCITGVALALTTTMTQLHMIYNIDGERCHPFPFAARQAMELGGTGTDNAGYSALVPDMVCFMKQCLFAIRAMIDDAIEYCVPRCKGFVTVFRGEIAHTFETLLFRPFFPESDNKDVFHMWKGHDNRDSSRPHTPGRPAHSDMSRDLANRIPDTIKAGLNILMDVDARRGAAEAIISALFGTAGIIGWVFSFPLYVPALFLSIDYILTSIANFVCFDLVLPRRIRQLRVRVETKLVVDLE